MKKLTKNSLLRALFLKARKEGIASDELREHIAPTIIGKRLSEATAKEVMKVIETVAGHRVQKYAASRAGLIDELTDAARVRWGEEFEGPLNTFVNSHRSTVTHYKFLPTKTLKVFKNRLKELNVKDPVKDPVEDIHE